MVSATQRYKRKDEQSRLEEFLHRKADEYNRPEFILADPISVPHTFSLQQDIEIAGFFAALFAWGNRKTIIAKSKELMKLMDDSPYDFVLNHRDSDLKAMGSFKHRTFNSEDLYYFIEFLQGHYSGSLRYNANIELIKFNPEFPTLETAFTIGLRADHSSTEDVLRNFFNYFFSIADSPKRTRKHISTPAKNSACKRLSMFLRWMVRYDKNNVDFGIWHSLQPSQLVCPLDVHVARVAKRFGLIKREQTDWAAAIALTETLKRFDPKDPVRFDFALFGLGAEEKF
ncbi:TIGR02757 family protein [Pollutibacter soli]|uniref:TIGR02757 family protein n=1 Tax=Pollutibacter soli TaxID=3034157 RepID=UPI0030139B23